MDDLTWDMPVTPPKFAIAVVDGKNVTLVRHFFSDDSGRTLNDLISDLIVRKSSDL